jgi:hypothetical protein
MNSFLTGQKSAKLKRVKWGRIRDMIRDTPNQAIFMYSLLFSNTLHRNADVAKLADALDLGSSSREGV